MRFTILTLLAGLATTTSAQALAENEAPLEVMTTVGMVGDVARRIGGECASVESLMGPGTDPHVYQASAGDVRALQNADMILYSGYSLEGQLGRVLERFGRSKPTLAVAEAGVEREQLIEVGGDDAVDPHLWMDAGLWSGIIPPIVEAFSEQRPACAGTFQANGEAYARALSALDEWIDESVSSIPERQRVMVTAHDAFNYYGRAYDLEVNGIQGISTEAETGIADIREMAASISERGIPAMFIESTINPRTVQAVIDAARQRGHEVRIGGQLYSDAMGSDDSFEGTYIGMLYANTRVIVDALGGTPAPLPEALDEWAAQWRLPSTEASSDGA